jgi:hypothetical protein
MKVLDLRPLTTRVTTASINVISGCRKVKDFFELLAALWLNHLASVSKARRELWPQVERAWEQVKIDV